MGLPVLFKTHVYKTESDPNSLSLKIVALILHCCQKPLHSTSGKCPLFFSWHYSLKLTILFTLVSGLHLLKSLFHMVAGALYLSLVWLEEHLHDRETLLYLRHQKCSKYWRNKNIMFICRMMVFKLMRRTMSARKWSCSSGDSVLNPADRGHKQVNE